MIELSINNQVLELSQKARIKLEIARAQRAGTIDNAKIYTSSLPHTDQNRKVLGMIEEVSSPDLPKRQTATLKKDSLIVMEGYFKALSSSEFETQYRINSAFSDFKQATFRKTLADAMQGLSYDFGTETTDYTFFQVTGWTPLLSIYALYIDNVKVAEVELSGEQRVYQALYEQALENPSLLQGMTPYYTDGRLLFLPDVENSTTTIELRYTYLFQDYVINALEYSESWTVIDNYEYPDFVFPKIQNSNFYGSGISFSGRINHWNTTSNRMQNNQLLNLRNEYSVVPFLKLGFILTKICEMAGFTWQGVFDEAEMEDLVLYNNFELARAHFFFKYIEPAPFNRYNERMLYRNHVPNMEIEVFLIALAYTLNLEMIFSGSTLTFTRRTNNLISGVSILQAPFKVGKVHYEEVKNFTLNYQDNPDNFFPDFEITNSEALETEGIKLPMGTLTYDNVGNDAISKDEGSTQLWSEYFELVPNPPEFLEEPIVNDFGAKLLFWRGLSGGQPIATAKPWVGANYNLSSNDPLGLPQFWGPWLEFLNRTKLAEIKIWMTAWQLHHFDVYSTIQLGHTRYFPLKLLADLENSSIQRAVVLSAYVID